MRSLEQWLAHQSQVHPQAIDLGLARLREVLERLDWRQPSVPVITVAGTNGKGSVTAYCAAILRAAGYRVGTFTSPHLRDYRERIRVHDRLVTNEELIAAFERIEAARMRPRGTHGGTAARDAATPDVVTPGIASFGAATPGEVSLTFFEYNALAAFLIFQAAEVDAWVLEVGMGGRLDAVNVVDPTVAVVVSIGLDHQEFLGDSLEAIAREKAGIFRKGYAAVLGRDLPRLPPPALGGSIQFANAATALAAIEELDSRLPVARSAVAQGLATVQLVGRFQVIVPGAGRPVWILDVAHNPDAARVLARNLEERPVPGRSLAVCGILADKDAAGIAAELHGCFDAWWLASLEGARGSTAAALVGKIAGEVDVPVALANDVAAACAATSAAAGAGDRIIVFGSFHTVGPALEWLDSQGLLPPTADPEYTQAVRGQ